MRSDRPPILLGTTNAKKIAEMRPLLESLGFRLVDLKSFERTIEVDETASEFLENAKLKAVEYAKQFGHWTIGEDSGLCVDALGGLPGVHSARYASMYGEEKISSSERSVHDQLNNHLLLSRLKDVALANRTAHYVSTIVLVDPQGRTVAEGQGECHGRIVESPRGSGGFGYDPLFEVIEYHKTFAELGATVKRAISHRARSLKQFLHAMASNQDWS